MLVVLLWFFFLLPLYLLTSQWLSLDFSDLLEQTELSKRMRTVFVSLFVWRHFLIH